MWYEIKVKHSIVERPEHKVRLLKLLRQQEDEIKETVIPYIQNAAYFNHSKFLILSLITNSGK